MAVTVREIGNDEWVIRGIPAAGINTQTGDLSTFYFKSDEISTSILSEASIAILLKIGGFERLAAINVGVCRDLDLSVEHTPVEDDDDFPDNPEHVSVRMPRPGRGGKANSLRKHAKWVEVENETPKALYQMLREQAESWSSESDRP